MKEFQMNNKDENIFRNHFDKESYEYINKYGKKNVTGHSFRTRRKLALEMLTTQNIGELLDIGGGPGVYLPLFKDRVSSYYLVDISSKMIEQAKKQNSGGIPYICQISSVYELAFDNNQFDTVLAMGLFEYLDSPKMALKNIKRVTKKGGNILVSFPNQNSPMRKWSNFIYKITNRSTPFASKMFTLLEVIEMAKELKLSIINIKGYNAQLLPFPFTWKFERIAYYSARILEPLLNNFGKMWGTSFIVKFRK